MNKPQDGPHLNTRSGTYSIGEHLRALGAIQADDEARILAEQRASGLAFGEAALKLGLIDRNRLVQALARQHAFDWPLKPGAVARQVFTALNPGDRAAESFRDLRTRLLMPGRAALDGARAIAVVSAERGDGRSFVAANLAVLLAQARLRTLVIDLDLRQPSQHKLFHQQPRQGVTGLLIGRCKLDELLRSAPHPMLGVLCAGAQAPNPQELLGPGSLGLLMESLRARFDMIVVDTPAWAQASDAQLAAAQCGEAVLVSCRNRSTVQANRSLVDNLRAAGVDMVGALLNRG